MRPDLILLWSLFVVGAGFAAAVLWSGLARQAVPALLLGPLLGALLGAGAALWWVEAYLMGELRLRPQVQVVPSSRLLDPALAGTPGARAAVDRWLADVEAQTRRLSRAGVLVLDESLLPRAARSELPPSWWLPTLDVEALRVEADGAVGGDSVVLPPVPPDLTPPPAR